MDKIKRDIERVKLEPDLGLGALNGLLEVVSTLVDRVLTLETRVAELEDEAARRLEGE